jgi:hypothetical protein
MGIFVSMSGLDLSFMQDKPKKDASNAESPGQTYDHNTHQIVPKKGKKQWTREGGEGGAGRP